MTSQFGCTDMLIEWTLPYLELLSEVLGGGRVAMSALTTAVRAATLRDELQWPSDIAARSWWYRRGWPARVAVNSMDDIAMLVRAGVTNVVDLSFCRCDVPEVYAEAATHFSTTVVDLRDVYLSDATSEHVAKFQGLRTLHCTCVSCAQLRTLSSCLMELVRLDVDSFEYTSEGVLDDMAELFPSLRFFPVLHTLPPPTGNDYESSLFVLSAARLALRLLKVIPCWSRDHAGHVEGVFKSYNYLFDQEHFDRVSEETVDVIAAMAQHAKTPNAVRYLSSAVAKHCQARSENRRTFGTAAMCDAIVAMSVYATTPDSVESLSLAIAKLSCDDEANQRILGTASMCDAMVAMSVYATTPESVESLSQAIAIILRCRSEDEESLHGTAALRDALVAMSVYETSP